MNTTRIISPVLRRVAATRFQTTASVAKPFRILGVQQIAIGSVEKGPLKSLWQDIFGFKPHASKRLEKENVEEDILKIGPFPYEVEVDLMTPIDPNGIPKVGPAYNLVISFFIYISQADSNSFFSSRCTSHL
jgi:hypothetical protein